MLYITVQGDTWDIIAKKVYGAEKYADYLMENNPSKLNTFVFSAGIEISAPNLKGQRNSDLPEWRQ